MLDAAKCKRCGRDILWVLTENEKRMCLDPTPSKRVTMIRQSNGVYRARVVDAYVPHVATCAPPGASEKRQPSLFGRS